MSTIDVQSMVFLGWKEYTHGSRRALYHLAEHLLAGAYPSTDKHTFHRPCDFFAKTGPAEGMIVKLFSLSGNEAVWKRSADKSFGLMIVRL
jgi:hypothetical protein